MSFKIFGIFFQDSDEEPPSILNVERPKSKDKPEVKAPEVNKPEADKPEVDKPETVLEKFATSSKQVLIS